MVTSAVLSSNKPKTQNRGRTSEQTPVRSSSIRPAGFPLGQPMIHYNASCVCGGGCPQCQEKSPAKNTSNGVVHDVSQLPAYPIQKALGAITISRTREIEGSIPPHPLTSLRRQAQHEGRSLPNDIRSSWGHKLGQNLSMYRIHNDTQSGEAVRALGVNAINFGNHLFFAPSAYDPLTTDGRKLLAHEVAHGLQTKRAIDGSSASARTPIDSNPALERKADQLSESLENSDRPKVPFEGVGQAEPAFRGDKQISFSGTDVSVRDTYVLHGPGVSDVFLERFRNSLNNYYNNQHFVYRGYNVTFNLSVRRARYGTVLRSVGGDPVEARFLPRVEQQVMIDSATDSDTKLFYVDTGSGRAGGAFEITLYETSTEGTIAHEVGHYLSDRVGYFSEGYSEGVLSRLGVGEVETTVRPEAEGDVMARSQTGTVGEFSLSGILDDAIDEHEAAQREQRRIERLFREGGYMGHGDYMQPGGIVVPVGPKF